MKLCIFTNYANDKYIMFFIIVIYIADIYNVTLIHYADSSICLNDQMHRLCW